MARYQTTLCLVVLNTIGLGLAAIGWAYGILQSVFLEDISKMTWVCAASMLLMVGMIIYNTFKLDGIDKIVNENDIEDILALPDLFRSETLMCFGLLGSMIGATVVMGNIGHEATDASSLGFMSLLHASMVGIVSKIWVDINSTIQSYRIRSLARVS